MRLAIDMRDQQRTDVVGGHVGNMEAANVAFVLDQRDDGLLGSAEGAVLSLATDVDFIGFHEFA